MEKKELVKSEEVQPTITATDVKKYFCENATDKEIHMFLNIARMNNLNPFKREVYLVKYGNAPASILTGYEVYLKRAERTDKYAGFKVWTEGDIPNMVAKIEVYRKDWNQPLCHEVEYTEYVGKTREGQPTRFWREKPKTMLKKVVISQAFRFAFPDELAGMPYTADEINTQEPEVIETRGKTITKEIDDSKDKKISQKQRKMLFALLEEHKISKDDFKDYLKIAHNLESTNDITQEKYEAITNWISASEEVFDPEKA